MLHFLKSLKSTGRGAIILPLGVLFRGNAEATIRRAIVERGYLKGIIELPANLFYGIGIAACILVVDKAGATDRRSIFMIDASRGYTKDGNKNRLRARDIHRMVDVFNRQTEVPGYSRLVPFAEMAATRTTSTSTCRVTSTARRPKIRKTSRLTCGTGCPSATWLRWMPTGRCTLV